MKLNFILEIALLLITIIGIFKALEAQVAIRDVTTSSNRLKKSSMDKFKIKGKTDEYAIKVLIDLEKTIKKILKTTVLDLLNDFDSIENIDLSDVTDEYKYKSLSPNNEEFIKIKEIAEKANESDLKNIKATNFRYINEFNKLTTISVTVEHIQELVEQAKPNNTIMLFGSVSTIIGVLAMATGIIMDVSLFASFIIVPSIFIGYFLLDRGIEDINNKSNNIKEAVNQYYEEIEEISLKCRRLINYSQSLNQALIKTEEQLIRASKDASNIIKNDGNDWLEYSFYNKRSTFLKCIKILYTLNNVMDLDLIDSQGMLTTSINDTIEKVNNLLHAIEKM